MKSFTKHNENSLTSLNVGQGYLIKSWLDQMKVKNYVINDDFTIDVNGCVNLSNKNLIEFPEYIQFNKISGLFDCSDNKLTSLEGCPKIIKGRFYCYDNKKYFTKKYIKSLCKIQYSNIINKITNIFGKQSYLPRVLLLNNTLISVKPLNKPASTLFYYDNI